MSDVNRLRPGLRARSASSVLALGALGVTSLTLAPSGAQAAPAAGRVTLAGTHPSWAVAAHRVGHQAVTSGTVRVRVYLAPRNAAGLAATAMAVSTPGSASYRHFLRPAQVRARYGPGAAQVSAIRSWLRSAGLRVTSVHNQVGRRVPGRVGLGGRGRQSVRRAGSPATGYAARASCAPRSRPPACRPASRAGVWRSPG